MAVFFGILLFSFLIFIHELGHFVAAKLSGVQVNEFSMFMGPAVFKKQIGETFYSLRCIPIGGYCAMEGEDADSDNPRSFQKVDWWKRLLILVAGSFMNFVAGFLIFAVLFLPGEKIVDPVIKEFSDCCVFNHENGLQIGDEILELDGEKIYVNSDISLLLDINQTVDHDVVVLRDGVRLSFSDLTMAHTHLDENGSEYTHYGFTFGLTRDASLADKLGYVWDTCINTVRSVRLSLRMLINGRAGIRDMTGPVGIVKMMSDSAAESGSVKGAMVNMLYFGGFIAINLAVMNMLPIPALDGGRSVALLLTTAVEKLTKKKIDPKYEGYIHGIGMIVLFALMAIIMLKDIFVIIKG